MISKCRKWLHVMISRLLIDMINKVNGMHMLFIIW